MHKKRKRDTCIYGDHDALVNFERDVFFLFFSLFLLPENIHKINQRKELDDSCKQSVMLP